MEAWLLWGYAMQGIRISVYAVAAVSAAVTVAVALFPTVDPASSAPSLRVAISTAPSLIASFTAVALIELLSMVIDCRTSR